MVTEDYVSFETAKLLKEKGFDDVCHAFYDKDGIFINFLQFVGNSNFKGVNEEKITFAPTLQMTVKWLRKKGFHVFVPLEIDYDEDERGDKWYHDATYYPEIRRVSDGKIMYDDGALYATPEQAYKVAIRYCLENLI